MWTCLGNKSEVHQIDSIVIVILDVLLAVVMVILQITHVAMENIVLIAIAHMDIHMAIGTAIAIDN